MRIKVPHYFKSSYEEVVETVNEIKAGKIIGECCTPGNRKVYALSYGIPNTYERTANYSSALGAGNIKYYSQNKKPCVMIIGGVHGGEMEGIASLLNLICLLETGKTFYGKSDYQLVNILKKCHLVLIPCANPDGRSRVPFSGVAGMDLETFRYYDQGAWKDGTLCNYPECKSIHPMKNVSFLGGYFNDNGINLMHDDFFKPMADETKLLFNLATEYAPDIIINLHGAANMGNGIYAANGMIESDRSEALRIEKKLSDAFKAHNIRYIDTGCFSGSRNFNLTTALHFSCGAQSITWECHQGVVETKNNKVYDNIYDEILFSHFLMFKVILEIVTEYYANL